MLTESRERSLFVDHTRIIVRGGRGGNGCLSFRREKFVPWGGPDGGNGGRGGDVILVADPQLKSLLDLSYKPHFYAEEGEAGQSSNKAGRGARDLVVRVPVGTLVFRDAKLLADLSTPDERFVAAKGGRGGRGNAAFKTQRNTAPHISEKGEPGAEFKLDLELKLLADVGLIGCPNAGKSTLLSRLTSARPKIADYPFTTLNPNLGVASWHGVQIVLADIPGLIEGAHAGKGLGHDFLRHIERTRVLFHLVDISGFDGKDPYAAIQMIHEELKLYSPALLKKPMVIVANKMDVTGAVDQLSALKRKLASASAKATADTRRRVVNSGGRARLRPGSGGQARQSLGDGGWKKSKIFPISAATGEGLNPLLAYAAMELARPAPAPEEPETEEPMRFVIELDFEVEREPDGFRVKGPKVERLAAMTHFGQEEGARRFMNILKKMGVEKELERQGVEPGDTVKVGNSEFFYELDDEKPRTNIKKRYRPRRR